MKVRNVVLLLCLMSLLPGWASAKGNNPFDAMKLPFKSATIQYTISGMEEGTEVQYIDQYGARTATYHTTVTSMMGMKMENNTIEIEDPDWVYSYDLVEGVGSKTTNPTRFMREEYEKLNKSEKKQVQANIDRLGAGVLSGLGGAVEQKVMDILGYSCDRAEVMGSVVYSIHQTPIVLKSEANVMGMKMSTEATSIQKGSVDERFFQHPAGIEAEYLPEADEMARQIAVQTIAWLKDPEASQQGAGMMPMGNANRLEHVDGEDMEEIQKAMEAMKGLFQQ